MATVYEHKFNTESKRQFLVTKEATFELSMECLLFEVGVTSDGRARLNAEKITDLGTIDLREWVYTPHYSSSFSITATFVHGDEWKPFPIGIAGEK